MAEILILGGDKRLQYAAATISKRYSTEIYKAEQQKLPSDKGRKYKAVVLGIPCSADGESVSMPSYNERVSFTALCDMVDGNGIITGGLIPEKLYGICGERGIVCEDYYKNESVILKNAVPSAEGALALGINLTADTICNANVLITGYGRIASLLAKYLTALGAKVTVAARKEEKRVLAEINGCKSVDFDSLADIIGEFSLIYNTVPALVIDEEAARRISKSAVYIELASKNGIDAALCGKSGVNFVGASGLPAKTAPKTAGEIIAKSIMQILDRHGEKIKP